MKIINNTTMRYIASPGREHYMNKVTRRLLRKIKQQKRDYREYGKKILNKLQKVDESVEIIARGIAKLIEGREQ
jgi:predicted transcriptional regulator